MSNTTFTASGSGTDLFSTVNNFDSADTIVIAGFDLKPNEELVFDYLNGDLSVSANSTDSSATRLTATFTLTGPGGVDFGNASGIPQSGVPNGAFTFTTLSNGGLQITVDTNSPYIFNGTAGTNFDNSNNYADGWAPGYTLAPGVPVTIISGTAAISTPTLENNGTVIVTGPHSTLISTASIGGTGTIDITSGGHVTLGITGEVTNEISFGTGGTALDPNLLDLNGAGSSEAQLNSVANFGAFDTIIVSGFTPVTGDSLIDYYNAGTGVLSVSEITGGGQGVENFFATIAGPGAGALSLGNFIISDSASGLVISDQPCFAAGTRILTPDGEKPVETLKAGDKVLTVRPGLEGVAEIIWVGQRTIDLARHAMPQKARPVRILAGAFGPGLPERDLRLSPDHALYIDGHLIEAKTLVNGVTVIAEHGTRYVTYHHIELSQHDVVLAEGLAAETYLDSGNRANFETGTAPIALHPDFVAQTREKACATLLVDGPAVIAVRQKLLDRALALGFAAAGDVDLVLHAAGERIEPQTDTEGELLFVLPAGLQSVELLSGTGVPAEFSADPADRRALGINVASLAIIANGRRQPIALDDAGHDGFMTWRTGAAGPAARRGFPCPPIPAAPCWNWRSPARQNAGLRPKRG